jgi:hypothetical protein
LSYPHQTFITEIEKQTPKVHLEIQKASNRQGNTEQKKSNAADTTIFDFKVYYRPITTTTKTQQGAGTMTDMKTSGTEQKTQI